MKVINITSGKVINLDNFDCVSCRQTFLGEEWLVLAERKHKGLFGTETIEETIAKLNNSKAATALTNDIANAWAAGNPSFDIDKWLREYNSKFQKEDEDVQPNKNKEDPIISSIRRCEDLLRQHEELSSDLK